MSHRLTTWQKATALVPLALLSGAWTTSLAATGSATASTGGGTLPDGTSLPAEAIDEPASLSVPGVIAPGVPAGSAASVIASSSTNGIPSAALSAYQRAAQVIDSADPRCNIEWPLIAAIGRVESDHGRYGGNTLTDEGVSSPGIYGIPLDGSNGTATIRDTDAGELDNDGVFDRAVGPMQFIPSTWAVVGVDGDGDGVRNPQDIDDAALATAVYLCSGNEDLATDAGQRSAVYRYNHSQEYVDLVLSIMRAYSSGDFAAVPNGSASAATFTPIFDSVLGDRTTGVKTKRPGSTKGSGGSGAKPSGSKPSGGSGGSGGGTGSNPGTPSTPGTPSNPDPSDTVKETEETVKETLTPLQKATAYCQQNLTSSQLNAIGGMSACTSAYLNGGAAAVDRLVAASTVGGGATGGLPGLPGIG